MTIYLDNLEAISVRKVIKKIRKNLQKDTNNKQVIELYFIGETTSAPQLITASPMTKLKILTNYLLQIKNKCIIRLTFRGYITNTTRMLLFTPFTKIISQDVLELNDKIVNEYTDVPNNEFLTSYKKLVNFDNKSKSFEINILDLPNITLIKID